MLALAVLALSCRGAGAFLVHVASSCLLAANGSTLDFAFTVVFNKNPLVCYEGGRFAGCDGGLLSFVADAVAAYLNANATWAERAAARRQACRHLAANLSAQTLLRRTRPQARIIPATLTNAPGAVRLTCHVWGFYPSEVTVLWLRDGDVVGSGDTAKILPNGNWTYQTQVALTVTAKAGDTYMCSVQHASLNQPLRKYWSPGLSPTMTLKVAVAAALLTVGLVVFSVGVSSYCCWGPGAGSGGGPGPRPDPGPGPSLSAGPGPSLDPAPAPAPGPSLDPDPGPGLSPGPGPSLAPAPTPGPSVDPAPGPSVDPAPGPGLDPAPGPGLDPGPNPHPGSAPGPSLDPDPDLGPGSDPSLDPGPRS